MVRPLTDQPLTFEDAARLDPEQHAGELDAGRWSPVTRTTWRHGEVVFRVCLALGDFARRNPDWSISTADPGTKLARNTDVLRGPDVAVARAARRPQGSGADGWLEGAPDLAIEVAGDSQSTTTLIAKAIEYLDAGG